MLLPNPLRQHARRPIVKLGEHFHHIQDYLERYVSITCTTESCSAHPFQNHFSPPIHPLTHPLLKYRIPHGVPDIIDLEHLTVAGDVVFGAKVILKGTVIIVANEGSVIMIPDGTVLEDKVVTGNFRILDH